MLQHCFSLEKMSEQYQQHKNIGGGGGICLAMQTEDKLAFPDTNVKVVL